MGEYLGLDSDGAGPCNATAGDPAGIIATTPELSITFSNIKWGELGSTFNRTGLTVVPAAEANSSPAPGASSNKGVGGTTQDSPVTVAGAPGSGLLSGGPLLGLGLMAALWVM